MSATDSKDRDVDRLFRMFVTLDDAEVNAALSELTNLAAAATARVADTVGGARTSETAAVFLDSCRRLVGAPDSVRRYDADVRIFAVFALAITFPVCRIAFCSWGHWPAMGEYMIAAQRLFGTYFRFMTAAEERAFKLSERLAQTPAQLASILRIMYIERLCVRARGGVWLPRRARRRCTR